MKFFKKNIRKLFRFYGFDIVYYRPKSSFDNIYKNLFKNYENEIVICDVGSHRGESIERFKRVFQSPIIHAFEPVKGNYECLEKYSDSNHILIKKLMLAAFFKSTLTIPGLKSEANNMIQPQMNLK